MLMEKRIFFFASKYYGWKKKTLIREREKARNGRVFCTQKFRFWCLTTIIIIFDTPRQRNHKLIKN